MPHFHTHDATIGKKRAFFKSRAIEQRYARELRGVAREIGRIVKGFPVGTEESAERIRVVLGHYSKVLAPWARAVASRIIGDLDRQDKKEWQWYSRTMSRSLQRELDSAVAAGKLEEYLGQHVGLITSLPTEAAERVHKLTYEGLSGARRAKEVAEEILNTGHVTASRAMLIARTETSRTAAGLLQVRAEYVGSDGYIWRTSNDGDVRPSHKEMAGQFVRWDSPPTLDKLTGHAGCLPNCRCYAEPVIPEHIQ